jgi:hypothetical protein
MDDGWEAAHSTDFQKISRNFEQSSANGPTPSRILPGSQAIRSNPSERKTALNTCRLRAKESGSSGVRLSVHQPNPAPPTWAFTAPAAIGSRKSKAA